MAIPREHLPHHGSVEGKVLPFPKRPLSLPRRFAVAALGLATALTGSEITNVTNFTGLVEPIGGVPAFAQPVIGGGSRDLNPNHSQATIPHPGGRHTPTTETTSSYEFGGFTEDMYIQPRRTDNPFSVDNSAEPRELRFVEGAERVLESQLMTTIAHQKGIPVSRLQAELLENGGKVKLYIPQRANDIQDAVAPPVFVRPLEIEVDLSKPVSIKRAGGVPAGANSGPLTWFETTNTVNIGVGQNGGLEFRFSPQRTWGSPLETAVDFITIFESIADIPSVTDDAGARIFMDPISQAVSGLYTGTDTGYSFTVDPTKFADFTPPVSYESANYIFEYAT